MAHHHTVFGQILKLINRHEFERLAESHHRGQRFRRMSRWSQFVALSMGQLSARHSLRDIVANLLVQRHRLYHLGCCQVSRSSLARVNEQQPYTFYEALFGKLYARCQRSAPGHGFRFKHKLYSLDASLIDLSLKIFPWAHYALGKAAMKLHIGLDHSGYLPAFANITVGKTSDIEAARALRFPKGSIVVCDKGYTDYRWFKALDEQGIFFVTRLRRNAKPVVLERKVVGLAQGITSDAKIRLGGVKPKKIGLPVLRRVGYREPQTGKHYVFLTNAFHLSAKTIADIYKQRWQIELFFKWIKQNLKIKAFLGISQNAVLTQIWAALCVALLLAYLKYLAKVKFSLQQILRLLQTNLFVRRDLYALLMGLSSHPPNQTNQRQLALA